MPHFAAFEHNQTIQQAEQILENLDQLAAIEYDKNQAMEITSQKDAALALLDLKMLNNFVSICQNRIEDTPKSHAFSVHRQALEQIILDMELAMERSPIIHLTYMDIVMSNPTEDTRVFSAGEVGKSESAFYQGHLIIEELLQNTIDSLKNAMTSSNKKSEHLQNAMSSLSEVFEMMKSFAMDLNKDHFTAFKPFLNSNPYTKEKGPSGAFSAKMPHIDVLIYGTQAPQDVVNYVKENKNYFPEDDFYDLEKSLNTNEGILNLQEKGAFSETEKNIIKDLGELKLRFHKMHKATVKNKMGENAHGTAEAGDAEQYLAERIKKYEAASRKLG